MKVLIHVPFSIKDSLRAFIHERVEYLDNYYKGLIKADVFLKTKDTSMPNAKIVEIRMSLSGNQIFADGHAESFEKAVAMVADRVKTQLLKRKDKKGEKRIDWEEERGKATAEDIIEES